MINCFLKIIHVKPRNRQAPLVGTPTSHPHVFLANAGWLSDQRTCRRMHWTNGWPGVRGPGFSSYSYHEFALWPWISHVPSLFPSKLKGLLPFRGPSKTRVLLVLLDQTVLDFAKITRPKEVLGLPLPRPNTAKVRPWERACVFSHACKKEDGGGHRTAHCHPQTREQRR